MTFDVTCFGLIGYGTLIVSPQVGKLVPLLIGIYTNASLDRTSRLPVPHPFSYYMSVTRTHFNGMENSNE